jgi:hypothetical protein
MSHTSNIKHVVTFALVTLATTITLPITASAQNRLGKLEQDARGVLDAERHCVPRFGEDALSLLGDLPYRAVFVDQDNAAASSRN